MFALFLPSERFSPSLACWDSKANTDFSQNKRRRRRFLHLAVVSLARLPGAQGSIMKGDFKCGRRWEHTSNLLLLRFTPNTQELMNHHLAPQQTWVPALHGQLAGTSSRVASQPNYKLLMKMWALDVGKRYSQILPECSNEHQVVCLLERSVSNEEPTFVHVSALC